MKTSQYQIQDTPFLQKSASHAILPGGRHPNDIRALAVTPDKILWIGTADGLFTHTDQGFTRFDADPVGCSDIKCLSVTEGGSLLTGTGLTLAERSAAGVWSQHLTDTWEDGAITATANLSGQIAIATSGTGLHIFQDHTIRPKSDLYPSGKRIFRLVHSGPRTWILGESGVVTTADGLGSVQRHELEEHQVRDLFVDGAITYYATSDGLYKEEAGSPLRRIRTPVRDLHSVCRTSLGITCGSSAGFFAHAPDRWHYFAGPRWLPSDDVRGVAEFGDTLFVATTNGLGRVYLRTETLERKEVGFESRIRNRHLRLKGFVATSTLEIPGDLTSNRTRPSDNDGLWTALYLASQSYRFKVTGDDDAREWAEQAFEAIEWLEGVTTIDGFPTKAIVAAGDDTGSDAVPWYTSAGGSWLWKGDCSSDEIDGHMYGYAIFLDLAASDAYRQRVIELVNRIMGPIVDNGYLL